MVCIFLTTQNWFHGSVPRVIGKTGSDKRNLRKYLPFGEKTLKISAVDTEIALLIVKKKEKITEGKIYSPVGKLDERAKLKQTCIHNKIH